MGGERSGPDFLGIGAMDSGSRWLHRNLRRHPGLWLPPLGALHYFDHQARAPRLNPVSRRQLRRRLGSYRRARGWRADQLGWDLRYFPRRRSDAWYLSLFRAAKGRVTGEITPDYSVLPPETIARVAALLPDLKLLLVMRDPIERSWLQAAGEALEEIGPAARELAPEEWIRRLGAEELRRRSDYPAILRHWGEHFEQSRILLAFHEEIDSAPGALLRRIFAFLGVEEPDAAWYADPAVEARPGSAADAVPAMPAEVRRHLSREYREILRELHERFGGRASVWYRSALEAPAESASDAATR